jgi:hypothetical protein
MFGLRAPLCGAVLCVVLGTGAAGAVTLNATKFGPNKGARAEAAMAGFLSGTSFSHYAVETFDDYKAWDGKHGKADPRTKVGRFKAAGTTGSGRSSVNGGTTTMVRSEESWEWGRHNVNEPALSSRTWLDSNDNKYVKWKVKSSGPFDTVAFFVTDAADVGGKFSIKVGDKLYSDLSGGKRLKNGSTYFVTITLEKAVESLSIKMGHNRANDGFGIDAAMVGQMAPAPFPPAAALLFTGVAALAGLRWRRGAA